MVSPKRISNLNNTGVTAELPCRCGDYRQRCGAGYYVSEDFGILGLDAAEMDMDTPAERNLEWKAACSFTF